MGCGGGIFFETSELTIVFSPPDFQRLINMSVVMLKFTDLPSGRLYFFMGKRISERRAVSPSPHRLVHEFDLIGLYGQPLKVLYGGRYLTFHVIDILDLVKLC